VKFHLDYTTVDAQAARLGARRIILTHMGRDMLAREAEARFERAHDGLVVTV
jgi:phosphoribosyl 1,2-cyclic phosphodiesterase